MYKSIFTIAAASTLLFASCQKDYYLEDLQDAQAQIEQLESINAAKQQTINELQISIANDQQTIAELNGEINSLFASIETLESLNAVTLAELNLRSEELSTVKAQLEESIILVADLTDELNELTAQRDVLANSLEVSQDEVDSLEAAIVGLEADLEAEKNNIKTVVEYVRVIETQIITEIVEVEVSSMPEDNWGYNGYDLEGLTVMQTPNNKSGAWYSVDAYEGYAIQIYIAAGNLRFAAFSIEGNEATFLGHSGRQFVDAINAVRNAG